MTQSTDNPNDLQAAMRVVRGSPTPEELAAVVAVLQSVHSEELALGRRVAKEPRSTWGRGAALMRSELTVASGQWGARFRAGLD
jgi:hypothetical protein